MKLGLTPKMASVFSELSVMTTEKMEKNTDDSSFNIENSNEFNKSFESPGIDNILEICIQKMWAQYDTKKRGMLNRIEAHKFVMESIKECIDFEEDEGEDYFEMKFETYFQISDKNNDGHLSSLEML